MKDENKQTNGLPLTFFILHPSAFILAPSSLPYAGLRFNKNACTASCTISPR